jgi:predicted transposase YbfD/YdcC
MKKKKISEIFKDLTEPRREWGNFKHKLETILVIGLCSIVCDGQDFEDMEDFGIERRKWLSGFLDLSNGIPDSDTFRRVFERLDSNELLKCLNQWLEDARESGGRLVNIDGKTICGSSKQGEHPALHVVTAWAHENELVLGQLATEEKSNEITAIPALLKMLDIEGDILTIDAMGCQTNIAAAIREKEADYVLAVKDNQPTLHEDIAEYFRWMERENPRDAVCEIWRSPLEKGHGRIEKREVRVVSEVDWLEGKEAWPGLQTLLQYRCFRTENEQTSVTDRYYISSFETSAEQFAYLLRNHWSIENRLHWVLDVVFHEDDAKARKDNSPMNLNILRKIAMSALKNTPTDRKSSIRRKMRKASLNPRFLHLVLFGS